MVSIFLGPQMVYRVFDMANVAIALIVIIPHWESLGISIPNMITSTTR
jgi:hypothetical protein